MKAGVIFQYKHGKFAVGTRVVLNAQNVVFHVVVLQRTAEKYTKFYNARAEPLFCS